MGAELTIQLAEQGCFVALCDVNAKNGAEIAKKANQVATGGATVTAHVADVSKEADWLRFRDDVLREHKGRQINLLFCNAGVAGGWSFINTQKTSREQWEQSFGINWYGVYYGCRTFMPLIVASPEGAIVNTSSINGMWASTGTKDLPHTR